VTRLSEGKLELPATVLGPENPLPSFREPNFDRKIECADSVPTQDRTYLGWETARRILPYRMQDSYTRERHPQCLPTVILENEILRAAFLPGLGGRLYSLVHVPSQRELLDRNPILQFANVALRNAWFSGGIEWNLGQLGHHYLTSAPLFAAEIKGAQDEPALRIYEFERCKRLLWQIDFHLPPESHFLFASTRVINLNTWQVPMYWWTNIAVPELREARTLMPADMVFVHSPGKKLDLVPMPFWNNQDLSRPTSARDAIEAFYRIPDGERPWIASLADDGSGLVETSTRNLKGRKMFAWGMGPGGRRWQQHLAGPGHAYIEIQAGLARTQLESLPMPGSTQWNWTEAFGLLQADPTAARGMDWAKARQTVGAALERILPASVLEDWNRRLGALHDQVPRTILHSGSGWGALERQRMEKAGESFPAALTFPDISLGPEQAPWRELLRKGILPSIEPAEDPGPWMTQPEWEKELATSLTRPAGRHWLSWLHRGVMKMERGDASGAAHDFTESLSCMRSALALRNLAEVEIRAGRPAAALDRMKEAWTLAPEFAQGALARELLEIMIRLEHYADAYNFIRSLPSGIGGLDRIQILDARASVHAGDLDRAEFILNQERSDIREGERELVEIWYGLQERRLAAAENIPRDKALRERVRRDCKPPSHLIFTS
jgi:hypothetical protein